MLRFLSGAVIGAALLVSTTAGMAQAISSAPVVVKDPDDVTCKSLFVTGSRLPGPRVCRSNRDWAQMSADGKGTAEAITHSATSAHP